MKFSRPSFSPPPKKKNSPSLGEIQVDDFSKNKKINEKILSGKKSSQLSLQPFSAEEGSRIIASPTFL